jgi:hypothetical protein
MPPPSHAASACSTGPAGSLVPSAKMNSPQTIAATPSETSASQRQSRTPITHMEASIISARPSVVPVHSMHETKAARMASSARRRPSTLRGAMTGPGRRLAAPQCTSRKDRRI